MKHLVVLVGPPGSGKTTLSAKYVEQGYVRCSQDDQGRDGHEETFDMAVLEGKSIIVDRMNFNKIQRERYIRPAKLNKYTVTIIVKHESFATCFERACKRENHPTIRDSKAASSALNFFFSKYEKPTADEADEIRFLYPEGEKRPVVVCDLDGTLCNIEHRRHFIQPPNDHPAGEKFKKDWVSFSKALVNDKPNEWCKTLVRSLMLDGVKVVFASGRSDEYRELTNNWLWENMIVGANLVGFNVELYMRNRDDYRQDCIIKENILDFEILTRYTPLFFIDDRKQVVDMWRSRGYVCLQCDKGDF